MTTATMTNTAAGFRTVGSASTGFAGIVERLTRELRYRQTVRMLRRLDNATLADIGVERADIPTVAARSTGRFI